MARRKWSSLRRMRESKKPQDEMLNGDAAHRNPISSGNGQRNEVLRIESSVESDAGGRERRNAETSWRGARVPRVYIAAENRLLREALREC